jgi:hypothetical protein
VDLDKIEGLDKEDLLKEGLDKEGRKEEVENQL